MEIHVLDTETTGLNNYRNTESIVEISIVKADLRKQSVSFVYDSVVGYDTEKWNRKKKNAWIFDNTNLSLELVEKAADSYEVVSDVRNILEDKRVTSYNVAFDFGQYLSKSPWYLDNSHLIPGSTNFRLKKSDALPSSKYLNFESAPCIMVSATDFCKIRHNYYGYKFPTLDEANDALKTDGMGIVLDEKLRGLNDDMRHRALYDTCEAAKILIGLYNRGYYNID